MELKNLRDNKFDRPKAWSYFNYVSPWLSFHSIRLMTGKYTNLNNI